MPVLFEIVTQERLVYSAKVDMGVVDGLDGRLGILPNHSQLLTGLKVSELLVRIGKVEEVFAVSGGVLDVRPDRVLLPATTSRNGVILGRPQTGGWYGQSARRATTAGCPSSRRSSRRS